MNDPDSGVPWDEIRPLVDRFYENPSIDNYVALRRIAPRFDIEISQVAETQLGAIEGLLAATKLEKDPILEALSGDERAIDHLCLLLMERLIERRTLEANGGTQLPSRGKAISDALIGHLVVAMLEVLQQDSCPPCPALILLVRPSVPTKMRHR